MAEAIRPASHISCFWNELLNQQATTAADVPSHRLSSENLAPAPAIYFELASRRLHLRQVGLRVEAPFRLMMPTNA